MILWSAASAVLPSFPGIDPGPGVETAPGRSTGGGFDRLGRTDLRQRRMWQRLTADLDPTDDMNRGINFDSPSYPNLASTPTKDEVLRLIDFYMGPHGDPELIAGDTFPGANDIGQEFFRTDLSEWYTFDGTYWLGEQQAYSWGTRVSVSATATTILQLDSGNITATNRQGLPVGSKLYLQSIAARWESLINASMLLEQDSVTIWTDSVTSAGKLVKRIDTTVDVDAQSDGLSLEITHTLGNLDDPTATIFFCRRFDV